MSADALLFELIDTLNQAFPSSPSKVVAHIGANAEGRPALADLDASASDEAPSRPYLGRDDGEILDALNQMIEDLGVVTESDAGFVVTDGRLEVTTDEDRAIHVWLIDNANTQSADDDVIRLKRRFDLSEQNWLVHTPELFSRLNATESEEQRRRDAVDATLGADIGIGLDLDAGTCLFRHEVLREEWTAPVQLLGSFANHRRSLLWGWANDVVAPSVRNDVETFRASCTDLGLRALVQAELPCPIEMADRLVRHAAVQMKHESVLVLPYAGDKGDGVIWVATALPNFD